MNKYFIASILLCGAMTAAEITPEGQKNSTLFVENVGSHPLCLQTKAQLIEAVERAGIDNKETIKEAILFASQMYADQIETDISKTPYIYHPMVVAKYLVEVGKITDSNIILATILQDTLKHTQATEAMLRHKFGDTVTDYILSAYQH